MAARDDHQIRRLVGRKLAHRLIKIFRVDLTGQWESLAVGVTFTIIYDHDVKAGTMCHLVEVDGNVAGAEQVQHGNGKDRLHKNIQCAAAHQAGVVFGVLVQIECQSAGLFLFHDLAGRLPDFGFNASPTDGAHDRAVVSDQHLSGPKRRNRTADTHNSGHGASPTLPAQPDDLLVNIHPGTSFDYWMTKSTSQTGLHADFAHRQN